jgi:drug/metabolite transporter (DMT)-like permease
MEAFRALIREFRAERPLLAFAGAVLLIGSNLVAIRLSNRELPPFWGAGTRFAVAAVLFFAVMRAQRVSFPRGRALRGAVLYGAIGIAAYFALVYWGLVEVKAAYGQVLLSLVPLLTLFLSIGHGLERFHWRGLIGAIIATVGIALIFRQQIRTDVSGLSVFALIAAAFCAAQGGIVLKRYPPTSLLATNAVAMFLGAVSLLFLSIVSGEAHVIPVQPETWVAFVYLATLGTIGTFLSYMYVLQHWTASAASYQFVLAPVVAIILAALLLGEKVTADFFGGGGLVVAGVYFGAILPSRINALVRERRG